MANVDDDEEVVHEVKDADIEELENGVKGQTDEQHDEGEITATSEQKEDMHNEDARESGQDSYPGNLTPEQRKERNRKWREDEKRRAKEKREQTERELAMLRATNSDLANRLATIEKRSAGTELAALDKRITDAGVAYVHYKEQIAVQNSQGNHLGVAEATDKMLQAQREHDHYMGIKRGYQQNQMRAAQPSVDPRMMAFANKWMADNPWYNPAMGDEDSRRVLLEDNILIDKGFNPSSQEYWDELTKAVGRVLPHRTRNTYTPTNGNSRTSVGGGGGNGGSVKSNKGSFNLSAERVAAIKEAGMWDDPKKRQSMIENYKRYDSQH